MTTKPDRHFIAFVRIDMPWCSSPKAWEPVSNEIVLFEQACPAAVGSVWINAGGFAITITGVRADGWYSYDQYNGHYEGYISPEALARYTELEGEAK